MNFSSLVGFHQKWRDILVIGKTIDRDNKKYHIIGMTLSDDAKLYIIEPYIHKERICKGGAHTQRMLLKEHEVNDCHYLHCSDFYFGNERLQVQGGTGGSLKYSTDDYGIIQLFFDMMSAGWSIPEWLQSENWDNLQLITLKIANLKKLPKYSPQMPIRITHRPDSTRHIVEKAVTLNIGKGRSFDFIDHSGDKVWCYIHKISLIDVWKDTEEEFKNPQLAEKFSPDQIQQAKKHSYEALEQNCPKGMCYIGIEYECSKNLDLVFYSKQYLKSYPQTHNGSASFLLMRLKPDQEIGTHGLPLKGYVIQTPVPPDTTKVLAELFLYYERIDAWTEIVS